MPDFMMFWEFKSRPVYKAGYITYSGLSDITISACVTKAYVIFL